MWTHRAIRTGRPRFPDQQDEEERICFVLEAYFFDNICFIEKTVGTIIVGHSVSFYKKKRYML